MPLIFLSYRREDSPQASRVYDWLVQRFGHDAVFMDVARIPFAVSFPDYIRQAIGDSRVLIALIGPEWHRTIDAPTDFVRMEIEVALEHRVPVLPVLIGSTPMPAAADLPTTISSIALQNADVLGVSHDFHSHMQQLLPKVESILATLAAESVVTQDPAVIDNACRAVNDFLRNSHYEEKSPWTPSFEVIRAGDMHNSTHSMVNGVTLCLHRVTRLAELLELHFILSVWSQRADGGHWLAGWIIRHLERHPLVPDQYVGNDAIRLKIRSSDEDARTVWKMITDQPLQLSLAYIATISPAR
jgi:hypothetical protein